MAEISKSADLQELVSDDHYLILRTDIIMINGGIETKSTIAASDNLKGAKANIF